MIQLVIHLVRELGELGDRGLGGGRGLGGARGLGGGCAELRTALNFGRQIQACSYDLAQTSHRMQICALLSILMLTPTYVAIWSWQPWRAITPTANFTDFGGAVQAVCIFTITNTIAITVAICIWAQLLHHHTPSNAHTRRQPQAVATVFPTRQTRPQLAH